MLSVIDKKIIYYLTQDGRASYTDIAKLTETTPQVVKYKVERLLEQGIIQNFWAFCDYNRAAFPIFWGYWLNLHGLREEQEKQFYQYLENNKNVTIIMKSSGYADLMIGVITKDIFEQNEKVQEILSLFSPSISIKEMVIGITFHSFGRKYLLGSEIKSQPESKKSGTQSSLVKYDQIDQKILSLVQINGRLKFETIAEILELPVSTARKKYYRLLEEGIIQSTTLTLDYSKSGILLQRNLLSLTSDQQKLTQFITYCKNHPNIVNLIQIFGTYNVMIDIEAFDEYRLRAVKQELIYAFPELIREYVINNIFSIPKFSQLIVFNPELAEKI